MWHPIGIPATWSLDAWLRNAWESEDGPTKQDVCARTYYWGHGACWIDESRLALAGIGEDDEAMIEGARVFDITVQSKPGPSWRADLLWARELIAFAGPAGLFFSDGISLFSSGEAGLSRWDLNDGARTGHLPDFRPTHHHRSAGELAQLSGNVLVRWRGAAF